jgi:hypothetical protein
MVRHRCPIAAARLALPLTGGPAPESLEHRSVGTNGYVSTWGAITSICPPTAT